MTTSREEIGSRRLVLVKHEPAAMKSSRSGSPSRGHQRGRFMALAGLRRLLQFRTSPNRPLPVGCRGNIGALGDVCRLGISAKVGEFNRRRAASSGAGQSVG